LSNGQQPGPYKRRIRNYILDWRLQLRYTAVVTVLSALICGTLGYLIYQQKAQATATIRDQIMDPKGMFADDPDAQKQFLAEDMAALHKDDSHQIAIMTAICFAMIAFLSGFLIILTHRVAGPLFKTGLYFEKIQAGKLPKVYDLRKGDQFQDFFKKFRRMVDSRRDAAQADVAALGKLVAACEAANVPSSGEVGHVMDEVQRLMKEKEAALT
jgi:hypothetical protein